MNRARKIQAEVQRTLDCLDRVERMPEDPFFAARVLARLENLEGRRSQAVVIRLAGRLIRPVFIIFLLMLNILSAMVLLNRHTQSENQSRTQYISSLAEDVSLNQSQSILY
ncbi:hypothetical protein LLH00_10680 [bacterium]|nr:hypothetical protein [bacterium]